MKEDSPNVITTAFGRGCQVRGVVVGKANYVTVANYVREANYVRYTNYVRSANYVQEYKL